MKKTACSKCGKVQYCAFCGSPMIMQRIVGGDLFDPDTGKPSVNHYHVWKCPKQPDGIAGWFSPHYSVDERNFGD